MAIIPGQPISPGVGCPESLMVHFRVGGTPGLHPGAFSAVPAGLGRFSNLYPGLTSWATLSRPCGTHLERVVLTHPLKPSRPHTESGTAEAMPFVRRVFPRTKICKRH